jgi:hypothetical protein
MSEKKEALSHFFAACRVHVTQESLRDSVLKNTPHIYSVRICVIKYAHPTCYARLHALRELVESAHV